MKIALTNENSQNSKNPMIEAALKKVVEPMGHTVFNYGMYADADSKPLTYVQNGILAAVLLNSGAADYVVTGCGTGEGAMLACNSFPGVLCGHVADPLDAYTFAQVNDGNAVAMPFALKNGWGQELNLEYTFEKLFGFGSGNGYPAERVEPEQRNKKILDGVRAVTMRPLVDVWARSTRIWSRAPGWRALPGGVLLRQRHRRGNHRQGQGAPGALIARPIAANASGGRPNTGRPPLLLSNGAMGSGYLTPCWLKESKIRIPR